MKLQTRIQFLSIVLLIALLLLANGAVYLLFKQMTITNELHRASQQASAMTAALNADNAAKMSPEHLIRGYLPANGMIRIIDQKGKTKLAVATDAAYRLDKNRYYQGKYARIAVIDDLPHAFVSLPMIWRDGTIVNLQLVQNIRSVKQTLNLLKIVLTLASLLIIVPSFFAAKLLSRLILNPIHTMICTMQTIRRSNKFQKIELKHESKDELNQMARTFNTMIDQLQENFEKQQRFVSDASHELKTPLTVIESYAQLLKRWGKEKEDVLDESIEAIHSEALRMKELTRQMLLLAHGEEKLIFQKADLIKICRETALQLEKAYGRKIAIDHDEAHVTFDMDVPKIKQLIVILLDNALKYSQQEIKVHVQRDNTTIRLEIEDQGIGIPEKDLAKVFDRFFRVDKARSRETGGSGLGLSIARQIVSAHRGEIQLKSIEHLGTIVTIVFPITQEVTK
jgi:signal transduction histidine kinase